MKSSSRLSFAEALSSSQRLCAQSRELVQQACLKIRRRRSLRGGSGDASSDALGAMTMENQRNARGQPICPVCRSAIEPAESVGRVGRCMVHLKCWETTLRGKAPEEKSA